MTSPSTAITPTIGRRVWYWPSEGELSPVEMINPPGQLSQAQPFDAGVVFVHPDGTVNLLVTDHRGVSRPRVDVPFLAEGAAPTPERGWAQWMPYQVGQAKNPAPGPEIVAESEKLGVITIDVKRSSESPPIWSPGEAPKITQEMVNAQIVDETYTVLPSGRVTVCELTLKNGFTVRGESAVVFIENNVPVIGRGVARENAVQQIWQLLGYMLREKHCG